ncbi:MAG: Ig-like domain-containing protein [Myxococcota bacterium]
MSVAASPVWRRLRSALPTHPLAVALLLAGLAGFACSGGGGSSGGGAVSVSVGPSATSVTASQTQTFTATVGGASDRSVTWSVDGIAGGNASVGTITNDGVYTPGSAEGPHTVRATSNEDGTTSATATVGVTFLPGVFTFHNDVGRTGQNRREYALTPSSVGPDTFGKLFSCTVDGQVYAQPLYVADLAIAGGVHNVVFVATEHDSVYAFDADASPCVRYWKRSFLGPNVTPIDPADTGEDGDLIPEIGITGTPVIDPASQTLYVVPNTREPSNYFQRLHALDLATGNEKFGGPVVIQAQVPGTGHGTDGTNITFEALNANQRGGLLLHDGIVYIPFASHGLDHGNPHGWLIGYDATSLARVRVYSSTANADSGGIWMSGDGPAVDSNGDIYFATGNGGFSATNSLPLQAPNDALGDSVVRLSPDPQLAVADFFTPQSQASLATLDFDLGSGGVVVIPDGLGPGGHPDLLTAGGKEGLLYVLDRDDMGRYTAGGLDDVVQKLDLPGTRRVRDLRRAGRQG